MDWKKARAWVIDPNRRWTDPFGQDKPLKMWAWIFAAGWAPCWYLVGDMEYGAAAWALIIVAIILIRLIDKFVAHVKENKDYGVAVPWWKLVWNFFRGSAKASDNDDRWERLCTTGNRLVWNNQYPKLHKITYLHDGSPRAMVNPGALGGDLNSIAALAVNEIPSVMDCTDVLIEPITKGKGWITFYKHDPLEVARSVLDLPLSGTDKLSFGWQIDGEPGMVPYGFNIQISATSGAGKSKFFWNLFFDLLRDQTPTVIHFIDPKSEFAWFKQWAGKTFPGGHIKIGTYIGPTRELEENADEDEKKKVQNEVLEKAEAHFIKIKREMHNRQVKADEEFGPGEELETPTDDFPGVLTVIDEGLDVAPLFAKGMANTHMGTYMSQGRRTKDFVWMGVQAATVQEIGGIGKAFQLKVSLRQMTGEATKAALGIAESDGVPCTSIPLNKPGVGFYVTEGGTKMKFRTGNVSKDMIRHTMTTGTLPEGMITRDLAREWGGGSIRPHWGYRAFCEKLHIYSGETNDRKRRFGEHLRDDVWKKKVCRICGEGDCRWWERHVTRIETRMFRTREEARAWESAEIHALQPLFNTAGAGNNKRAFITKRTYKMYPKDQEWTTWGQEAGDDVVERRKHRLDLKAAWTWLRTPVQYEGPQWNFNLSPEVPDEVPVRKRRRPTPKPQIAFELEEPSNVVPITKPRRRAKIIRTPRPIEPEGYDLAATGTNDHLTHIQGYGDSE